MRRKHVPQRTCIVCRRTQGKRGLHRIVRSPEGVRYDPTGKLAGRGAYLCDDAACWHKALSTGTLARALKTTISADERAALQQVAQERTQTAPHPSSD